MIKFILLLALGISPLFSQVLPTIPKNVFRFTNGYIHNNGSWNLSNQNFNLSGLARRYFDNKIYDENGNFNSNYDLYYLGSTTLDTNNTFSLNYIGNDILDTASTVEEWLTKFNDYYGFSIPTLGKQNFDTTNIISINGYFDELRKKEFNGKTIKIDYGMSDEITISISASIFDRFIINQNFSNYYVGKANNVWDLIDYHTETRLELKNFIESSSFSSLQREIRNTLIMIYDYYYRNNSPYSVNWIFHSKDDPINNLIIDDKMKPKELVENDTLTLENIIDYYYPSTKKASGISDISIGATVLLHGNPAWKNYEKGYTLYGQFELSIPYGSTISAFQSNNFRTGQFKQASMGNGALGWGLGFLIEKKINSKSNSRIYVSSKVKLNSEATLNTPVQLFSGGHTNPDSALSYIGNTYKFKSGTILDLQLGGEKEVIDDRFLFRYTIKYKYKYKDKYISDSNDWNKWMESHDGYSSAYNIFNSGLELWFINSISQNKIGPFSFDIFAGYDTSIFTEHNYFENSLYGGITTHFQGW